MRTWSRSLALTGLLALLAGCPPPSSSSALCREAPSPARAYDALEYRLVARFDWDAGRLLAEETASLALCPGSGPTVQLDSRVEVSRLEAEGGALPFTAEPDGGTLTVDLSAYRGPRDPLVLRITYRAPTSDALAATRSVENDPVQSRVLFTDSEPRQGHLWLVEKDDPADRALFSVELEVAPGEDAVSNGERVLDQALDGGARRIGYALDVPLPTYLMAFAAGELEHADRAMAAADGGVLPLAVWWRRGLPAQPQAVLDAMEGAIQTFTPLLGPFPFRRYAVVLLPPPFGGGMENATITFDAESSGQGAVSRSLVAHETAHQWFGDWVTMKTYDDVWVKEGVATLLAAHDDRRRGDLEHTGRLGGSYFAYLPQDAIVDRGLTGLAKYTSGPYERAAAMLTQLRVLAGEDTFWATLRRYLATHALGSAGGETLLRDFTPAVGAATVEALLAALPDAGRPTLGVSVSDQALSVILDDPGGQLHAPLQVTAVDSAGSATLRPLTPGSVELSIPPGGYLALDERDAYPDPDVVFGGAEQFQLFTADFASAPGANRMDLTSPAGQAFLRRSPSSQEWVLGWTGQLPPRAREDLPGVLAQVDSLYARQYLLARACRDRTSDGGLTAPVVELLRHPPLEQYWSSLGSCLPPVARVFEGELLALAPDAGPDQQARLEYLLSFWPTSDAGVEALAAVASGGPTLRLRRLAAQVLATHNVPRPAWAGEPASAGKPEAPEGAPGPLEGRPRVRELEAKAQRGGR